MKDKILGDALRQKIKVSFPVENKPDKVSDVTTYDIYFFVNTTVYLFIFYYYCINLPQFFFILHVLKLTDR